MCEASTPVSVSVSLAAVSLLVNLCVLYRSLYSPLLLFSSSTSVFIILPCVNGAIFPPIWWTSTEMLSRFLSSTASMTRLRLVWASFILSRENLCMPRFNASVVALFTCEAVPVCGEADLGLGLRSGLLNSSFVINGGLSPSLTLICHCGTYSLELVLALYFSRKLFVSIWDVTWCSPRIGFIILNSNVSGN